MGDGSRGRRADFVIPALTVASDIIAIGAAFLASYWLRFHTAIFSTFGFIREDAPPFGTYLIACCCMIAVWMALFHSRSMYASRRNVNFADELINVAKIVTLGMVLFTSATFFYRSFSYSRFVAILLWGMTILFVYAGRAAVHAQERAQYRRGRNLKPAVIVGADDAAEQVYAHLNGHGSFGFSIVGYFAESPAGENSPLMSAAYLGRVSDAAAYIRDQTIELGFIALRPHEHGALIELINACEGVNVEFLLVPDILELLATGVKVREFEGIPFLTIKSIPLTTWGRVLKRLFDIAVSGTLLLVLSPILLLIAVAVKIDSRGPALFRQQRVGLDGKEFMMLKFRSMKQGAEAHDASAGLGIKGDPRRTAVGRFLRRTSLDELPQLFNVVRGDMSLVGPRPERTRYVEEFSGIVPKYVDRHRVKTGVTGWAQVNGLRGDTSIEERVKYDVYYIENWSLAFDIKILLRTLKAAMTFKEQEKP